ncbi:MAG: penicillin-binding protein activator LpoB [Candidatus Magnetomorum sp.]|nr:penicillin-binding protein activator LpoB [Candidatus Magnetomorum sp.]
MNDLIKSIQPPLSNKHIFLFIAILIHVCMISSCSSYHQQYIEQDIIFSKDRHVAVLPFYNLTAYPHAGRIISDLLLTELYAMTNFRLMDQTEVISLMNKEDDDMESILNHTMAIKIGKMLKVDTVIYGSVTEFRYKRSLNEVPVVSISIRLLDIKTNRVLWAGSKSAVGRSCWFCEDALTRLAQTIAHDLVKSMK